MISGDWHLAAIDDGGDSIGVVLCAHLWTGERLGELELSFDVAP